MGASSTDCGQRRAGRAVPLWAAGAHRGLAGPTVLGTFAVNISGTLLLGLFLGLTEERWIAPHLARTAVAIGFLGAYTTFSTLMFESVDLAESGSFATAALNICGSLLVGLSAMYAGLVIGRSI